MSTDTSETRSESQPQTTRPNDSSDPLTESAATATDDDKAEADDADSSLDESGMSSDASSENGGQADKPQRSRIRIGSQRSARDYQYSPRKDEQEESAAQPSAAEAETPAADKAEKQEDDDAPAATDQTGADEQPVAEVAAARAKPTTIPPPTPAGPVEISLAALDEDLDQELEQALGDVSLDEIMGEEEVAHTGQQLEEGSRFKAIVVKLHRDDVFFSISGRHEGVASLRQFKHPPEPGAMMDVVVTGFNNDDGLYELSIPGASVSVADWSDVTEGAVVEARITGSNTGGLECMVHNIRGFIPASQIALHRVDSMAEFIGHKMQCVVTEANPRRRNLVLSHRAILEREQEQERKKLLESIEVGEVREGTVTKIRDFGAFVDLGGVDGLIHISKMSWDHIGHPKEVFEVGQKISVKVEKVDPQTGKIGLTYRDLMEHPWTNIDQKFPPSTIAKGTISRIANFGAFVKLAAGVEGLIHISELAHQRVPSVSSVVGEGQEVEVKVLSVDPQAQRMALSLKATLAPPEPAESQADDDHPPRELAVARRKKPLKGGTDRSTGGEQFGLKW